MWNTIKKWFGLLDVNHDGKVTEADLNLAKELAGAKYSEAMEKINIAADKVDAVADTAKKTVAKVKAKTKKK